MDRAGKPVLQGVPQNEIAVPTIHLPGDEQFPPGLRPGGKDDEVSVGKRQIERISRLQRRLGCRKIAVTQQSGEIQVPLVALRHLQPPAQLRQLCVMACLLTAEIHH